MALSTTLGRCTRPLLAAVFTAAMLAACGGGGDDANQPTTTASEAGAAAALGVRVHAPQCDPVGTPSCGPTLPPTQ